MLEIKEKEAALKENYTTDVIPNKGINKPNTMHCQCFAIDERDRNENQGGNQNSLFQYANHRINIGIDQAFTMQQLVAQAQATIVKGLYQAAYLVAGANAILLNKNLLNAHRRTLSGEGNSNLDTFKLPANTPLGNAHILLLYSNSPIDGLKNMANSIAFNLPITVVDQTGPASFAKQEFASEKRKQVAYGLLENENLIPIDIRDNRANKIHLGVFPNPPLNGQFQVLFDANEGDKLQVYVHATQQHFTIDPVRVERDNGSCSAFFDLAKWPAGSEYAVVVAINGHYYVAKLLAAGHL